MNNDVSSWIIMGRFCRPHGIKGFVRVLSFTQPRETILDYPRWFIKVNNNWEPLKRLDVEVNHHHVLVRVENYATRELASHLTNIDIAVLSQECPTLYAGEYYWHDLIGLQVVHVDGVDMGMVEDMMATGSNDVMVVSGDKRRLIPYLPNDVVRDVDLVARKIIVDWDLDF